MGRRLSPAPAQRRLPSRNRVPLRRLPQRTRRAKRARSSLANPPHRFQLRRHLLTQRSSRNVLPRLLQTPAVASLPLHAPHVPRPRRPFRQETLAGLRLSQQDLLRQGDGSHQPRGRLRLDPRLPSHGSPHLLEETFQQNQTWFLSSQPFPFLRDLPDFTRPGRDPQRSAEL